MGWLLFTVCGLNLSALPQRLTGYFDALKSLKNFEIYPPWRSLDI
jgi:hypothetical protein